MDKSKDAFVYSIHILTVKFLSRHAVPDPMVIDYFNSYHNRLFHALMPFYSHAAVMRYNWFVMHILRLPIYAADKILLRILLLPFLLLSFTFVETAVLAYFSAAVSAHAVVQAHRHRQEHVQQRLIVVAAVTITDNCSVKRDRCLL